MPPLLLILLLTVVPKGEILVKGAVPAASDASTPVPEEGKAAAGRYRNAYFGLTYPIPAGWSEQPAGPPPSDSGIYVLAQFATARANVLVSAQDLFFTARPAASAGELLALMRRELNPAYVVERDDEVAIAGRTFRRLAYRSPRSGLRWRVLSTDARCHALTFTFTGTDPAALDAAEGAMRGLTLTGTGPLCRNGYGDAVVKPEPRLATNRYNTIPVRVIIDIRGHVKHVHLLSAFPEQSEAILTALRDWRFRPYRVGGKAVEVETGMVFGMPPRR